MPPWTHPAVREAIRADGINRLWSHQRKAADALHAGEHTVLSTGTASGKSLGFLLPALTAAAQWASPTTAEPLAEERPSWRTRPPTTLYLAPTKALAGDQLARLDHYGIDAVRAATYDGDTPTDVRRWVRRHANVILTNPDMLHRSLLPNHERWGSFWRGLRYVVIDESHTYSGVFGSHMALVLRRLRRVARHYGAEPTFAFASATGARAADHAAALLGLPVREVSVDGSPRAAATFAFVDPGLDVGVTTAAGRALATLVAQGAGTIAFARSRLGSEVVATRARDTLLQEHPDRPELAATVAPYRGGYLPEDRRRLEAHLRDGTLRGVAATSALELGIDISGLDAVVLAGWPGSRASLFQRAGRAGRAVTESLTVFLASDDPLDTYLVHHPEAVFGGEMEAATTDPGNPHVLGPHLGAAAYELPLRPDETDLFGNAMAHLADLLTNAGLLRRRPDGWYWTRQERPADTIDLRGAGEQVRIVEKSTGRVLGTVDEGRAHATVHTGAVYLHQQQAYVVTDLDLASGTATVVAGDPGWSTVAHTVSAFDIRTVEKARHGGKGVSVYFGDVLVRSAVTEFERKLPDGSLLGVHPLALPERRMATKAVWFTWQPKALLSALAGAGRAEQDLPGAAHAAEHAAIGVMPLVATVDRRDIGGVSTAVHPDTGLPTVMVYDGTPGGAGFAERGFDTVASWLDSTAEAIERCTCASGCPSCVQSPSCGSGNTPLDKTGALAMLRHTVAGLVAGARDSGSPEP